MRRPIAAFAVHGVGSILMSTRARSTPSSGCIGKEALGLSCTYRYIELKVDLIGSLQLSDPGVTDPAL